MNCAFGPHHNVSTARNAHGHRREQSREMYDILSDLKGEKIAVRSSKAGHKEGISTLVPVVDLRQTALGAKSSHVTSSKPIARIINESLLAVPARG
jgi:hypothetical protein